MTWMNLEDIMLSERSQLQRTTYCVILFLGNVQNRQIHRDRKMTGGCGEWEWGDWYWVEGLFLG